MTKQHEPINLGLLSEMLNFISADLEREEWARLLMAAKSEFGDDARETMREWSATASNFDKNAFLSTWKSIRAAGGVTIATLVQEAKNNGFKFAPLTKEDKARFKAEQKKRNAERKKREAQELEQQRQGYKIAREKANNIVNGLAVLANPNHGYFVNKGVNGLLGGLHSPLQFKQSLIVPVYQFKTPPKQHIGLYGWEKMFEVVSLQFIEANGAKRFLKGGQIKGGFFPVRFNGHIVQIVICEGIATAITYTTIYDQESEIIAAFNAKNLKPVARAFKLRYPQARIIIAGDNDHATERKTGANVGIKAAKEAAKAVDGLAIWPEFAPHESGTDFNDRYLLDYPHKAQHRAGNQTDLGGAYER